MNKRMKSRMKKRWPTVHRWYRFSVPPLWYGVTVLSGFVCHGPPRLIFIFLSKKENSFCKPWIALQIVSTSLMSFFLQNLWGQLDKWHYSHFVDYKSILHKSTPPTCRAGLESSPCFCMLWRHIIRLCSPRKIGFILWFSASSLDEHLELNIEFFSEAYPF